MSQQKAFVEKIGKAAVPAYKSTRVLPSLVVAQACLESSFGKRSIGNNIFGIKANRTWKGKKQFVWTSEQDSKGNVSKIQTWFRDYDSIEDCLVDHAKLLQLPRYTRVLNAKDYKTACNEIQKAGYATDIKYAQKLIKLIEMFELYKLDELAIAPAKKELWVQIIEKKSTNAEEWIDLIEYLEKCPPVNHLVAKHIKDFIVKIGE